VEDKVFKALSVITKHLVIAIPVSMVAGFLFGTQFDARFLKDLIPVITLLVVYPMMVTLQYRKVLQGGDTRTQLITQLINFLAIPFIAYGIGRLFLTANPAMALGLLLVALIPTSGMTITWTSLARGNVEAAVKMMIIGLTLGSLAAPVYVHFLLGAEIDMNILRIFKSVLLVVFVPMAVGFITQQWLMGRYGRNRFKEEIAPVFPPLSALGVLMMVFTAMALKARAIAAAPGELLNILIPVGLFYAVVFIIGSFLGKALLPRADAIALLYGTVLRNLAIALAIAANAFGSAGDDAVLVVSAAFIVQTQVAVWSVRLAHRIFRE
jgi:ACR3 family arsenite efflux pump ArsB